MSVKFTQSERSYLKSYITLLQYVESMFCDVNNPESELLNDIQDSINENIPIDIIDVISKENELHLKDDDMDGFWLDCWKAIDDLNGDKAIDLIEETLTKAKEYKNEL